MELRKTQLERDVLDSMFLLLNKKEGADNEDIPYTRGSHHVKAVC